MSFSMQKNTAAIPSYPESYTNLIKQEKPVLIFFYADWCTHCVRFMPTYAELEKTYKDRYNFIKVNVDSIENASLAQDYYVMGIPAIYIVEPKTQKRHEVSNYILHDKNALKKELEKFLRR